MYHILCGKQGFSLQIRKSPVAVLHTSYNIALYGV